MHRQTLFLLLMVSLFMFGCSGTADVPLTPSPTGQANTPAEIEGAGETETPVPTVAANETPTTRPTKDRSDRPPTGAQREFSTDFLTHSIPYTEVLSGGPPKDGIPAIDEPQFETTGQADDWLNDVEPVVVVELDGMAKIYPIQILTWHEIVNDQVGDVPVTVTFCPLCNTAIAFDRRVGERVLDFGTTGRLRFSNLIMYDRQTESWWQQATGESIVGTLTGQQLRFVPAVMVSWAEASERFAEAQVLSRETGHLRAYGRNPYAGYDDINSSPFLYDGPELSGQLPPLARVLKAEIGGEAVAYPFKLLQEMRVANDVVGQQPVVVLWTVGTASALDTGTISEGRDVGSANIYAREVDGRALTFVWRDGQFVDEETGSVWNGLGQAMNGPLQGAQLAPLVGVNHFWFSWVVYRPDTRVYTP